VTLYYYHTLVTDAQAENIGHTFAHLLGRMYADPSTLIRNLDYMSPTHLQRIWDFNKDVPEPWMECFHEVIQRHAANRPDAPAIDGWDGHFTYRELVDFAKSLAMELQSRGVHAGVVVPICFERSAWALVAMLAVSFAGGGFVSVPPTLPPARIDAILEILSAPLIITKSIHSHLWEERLPWLDIVSHNPAPGAEPLALAKPTDLFYVIFTSGSTGVPKGVMVSHCNWLDGALRNAHTWGYRPDGRVLQRLNHTFDMSLLEICSSLGSGGCVCVPTVEEVDDSVADVINKYRITHTIGTPSLAKSLTPEQVPGLKTMCLGGEAFPKEIVTMWSERINLFQFYGPSECSINSSSRPITRKDCDPLNIGPPNSAALWVVDAHDHNKLVPIGAIGELVVSGPIVGMGYLKNPVKTAQVFLDSVDFVPKSDPLFGDFRFYKTGDLVRWNADGTVSFCGRADTEVKLNGQRIELGEVEYHLALDPNVHLSMALLPKVGRCNNNLTAVLTIKSLKSEGNGQANGHTDEIQLLDGRNDPAIRKRIRSICNQLQNALPQYMVPTVWVFLAAMPMSTSGKMDRVRVRTWIEQMSEDTFAAVTGKRFEAANRLEYTTYQEHQIQQVWSTVLRLPAPQVGLSQPFVALGGDSIKALQVVAKCRGKGILTTIADTLTCEGVSEAASLCKPMPSKLTSASDEKFDTLWDQLRDDYDLSKMGISELDEIEDVYPCTKMQEALFLGSIRRPGSYHMRFFYKINSKSGTLPEVDQLKAAWATVVARHPSLRTIYVDDLVSDAIYHSIVLKKTPIEVDVHKIPFTSPEEALDRFTHSPVVPFQANSPHHRLVLLSQHGKVPYMMLEISHVIMDGSSQAIFLGEFVKACSGTPLPPRGPAYRDVVVYQRKNTTQANVDYWASYMKDCQPCLFPVTGADTTPLDFSKMRRDIIFDRGADLIARCNEKHITIACAIRAAWAMVLRAYTSSQDVCFGYVVSLRNAPVKDIENIFGVCIGTQPCRVRMRPGLNMIDLARAIQKDYLDMVPHQHYPLTETLHNLELNGGQPLFNTVLSMEWIPPADVAENAAFALEEMREQDDPAEYDLGISIDIRDGEIKLGFLHWPWISEFEITHLSTALQNAMSFFIDSPDESIEHLSLLRASDIPQTMPGLNSLGPLEQLDDTILSAIARQSKDRPDATAIESWDGHLSYEQVDEQSSVVAKDLVDRGVVRGDAVIFCMDRSAHTIVTMLGIMKAGGIFVATSSESPKQRLRTTIHHCCPKLVIADPAYVSLFEGMTVSDDVPVQIANASTLGHRALSSEVTLPKLSSEDLAYIVYTSGSTGVPKGIMIEHGSLATSVVVGHGRRFKYSSDLRVLHFISLTFDISIMEIFTTLAFGGCLCIPSEKDRMSDLIGSMNRLKINLAILTPSICRLFSPADVPSLKILGLGGEAMTRQDLERFADRVEVYNGYGPAEATILVSALGPMKTTDDPTNIGFAVDGSRLWVAEVDDTQRLAPVGSVGELVVESRQLARGYIHDEAKTSEVFVENLPWLAPGVRVYKTGDLVRYAPGGSLRYLGRKDTQIKLRGHRIELSQIEHHLRECWPQAHVAVESIVPEGETNDQGLLAAILSDVPEGDIQLLQDSATNGDDTLRPVSVPSSVQDHLARNLPGYMVPSVFFVIEKMPITVNGKLDRKQLRERAEVFTIMQLTMRKIEGSEQSDSWADASELECRLRAIWAQILAVEQDQIHPQDSFFQLGGNSILAMKLSVASRQQGIHVTVPMLFRNPTIKDLGCALKESQVDKPTTTSRDSPFSLLPEEPSSRQSIFDTVKDQCCVSLDDVEDVYPATPLQEGMVSLTARHPGAYTSILGFSLPENLDFGRFQVAWQETVTAHPILRTRIIQTEAQGCFQVMLRTRLAPSIEKCNEAIDPSTFTSGMGLGNASIRLCVMPESSSASGGSFRLIIAMHHSVYDGWSLPLLTSELQAAYEGAKLVPRPFKPFIQYLQQTGQATTDFWKKELDLFGGEAFPALPSTPGYQVIQNADMRRHINLPVQSSGVNATLSTKMRLAWAVAVSRYTNSQDIVFGVTTAGRALPIDGIELMLGPTIATIPVRIQVDLRANVASALHAGQDTAVQSMEHEHIGIQHIAKLGPSAAAACQFQTLIIFESAPGDEALSKSTLLRSQQFLSYLGEETYALVLYCDLAQSELTMRVKYDRNVVTELELSRLLDYFEHILAQLMPEPNMKICEIDTLRDSDWSLLRHWNTPVTSVESCVYDEFYKRVLEYPEAEAVCAWDGSWSYQRLHEEATTLAKHLIKNGVGPEVFVPLYFEKSKWVSVAMLAVVKVGGIFVPLDVTHPSARLQDIVQQLSPPLIMVSPNLKEAAEVMFGVTTITPGMSLTNGFHPSTVTDPVDITPSSGCYAIFTSGSTGKPKGTVVTHRGILSSMLSIVKRVDMNGHSRMLQFSSAAWDGSVLEYLTPWLIGGCVCIPSEFDRRDALASSIAHLQANWLHLTPSVLRTLHPSSVPSIRDVMLLGESPTPEDYETWASEVNLIQAYGPTECSVACTLTGPVTTTAESRDIGRPSACTCWVVDPNNHDQLVPIGAVGELVVEGPIVNRGYLGNPEKTAECFIERPGWFPNWYKGAQYQLYKTGDLARYGADGNLIYLGRKDTQVKVNGQRMELEEIGVHLRRTLPDLHGSVIDVVGGGETSPARLTAFIQTTESPSNGLGDGQFQFLLPTAEFQAEMKKAEAALSLSLPPYMVPILYIPISRIPLAPTGKTDRRRLLDMASSYPASTLQQYVLFQTENHQAPCTEEERLLHSIWTRALHIDPDSFGVHDDFFQIGGDSITGMQVTTKCNSLGLTVSSADLFQHRTISRLVEHLRATKATVSTPATADAASGQWSLSPEQQDEFVHHTLPEYGLSANNVEDVYPCSPVQQGILLTQIRDSRYYQNRVLLEVAPSDGKPPVSAGQLAQAWKQVVQRHPVLRTLFISVSHDGLADQVVLRNVEPHVRILNESDEDENEDTAQVTIKGRPDHRLRLRQLNSGKVILEWKFNHVIIDAMSLAVLQRDITLAYEGRLPSTPGPQYRQYIDFIQGLDYEASRSYWEKYLESTEQCILPSLTRKGGADTKSQDIRSLTVTVDKGDKIRAFCQKHGLSLTNVFHIAWALVLRCYLATDSVCFGYQIYGRDFPAHGVEDIIGPFVNTLATHVNLSSESSLLSVLKQNQDTLLNSHAHRYYSLAELYHGRKLLGSSLFNTGISVQDLTRYKSLDGSSIVISQLEAQDRAEVGNNPLEFSSRLNVGVDGNQVDINLAYWSSILSDAHANTMAETICRALDIVLDQASNIVADVDVVNEASKSQAIAWNTVLPGSVDGLVFTPIIEHSIKRPEAEAVCAWDGSFTYGEIDQLSSGLAEHLLRSGLVPESIVPVYMEKSRWAVVAMLAVLKAGAALATLDVSHPLARLQDVCADIQASIVLASAASSQDATSLATTVIVVGEEASAQWAQQYTKRYPSSPKSSSPAYVIFTSGSTGKPKASVIDHRGLTSMAHKIIPAVGLNEHSRAFQFASYAFDVSVQENLLTLCAGGCVCIPSERERKDNLVGAMTRMKVNFANFTPSVMRILKGEALDPIKTVIIGGEAPTPGDMEGWPSATRIINTYGPSECTIFCVITDYLPDDPRVIGKPLGCNAWVVDRRDHHKLVPIGAVGELMIEGPSVSRVGYINNPEKTAAAFVEYPEWLAKLRAGKQERLYKSGDLVQYREDGSIRFIGRKDNQVKVRGQRIELGEVEYHLLRSFPRAKTVVADVITPKDGSSSNGGALLMAFILQESDANDTSDDQGVLKPPTDGFQNDIATAENLLRHSVPAYMVPSIFLPVNVLPQTTSFKTDRKSLRKSADHLSQQELFSYNTTIIEKRPPSTQMEASIQGIVARVLDLSTDEIGMDDDFFRLGGDSVGSMRAVSIARREGIILSVVDIFEHPKLCELALAAVPAKSAEAVETVQSCSLLKSSETPTLAEQIEQDHWFIAANVEDVLPTTQFQRESLDQTCTHFVLNILGPIDVQRLDDAILELVKTHEVLRTVFVPFNDSIVQVVLRKIETELHVVKLDAGEDLESHVDRVAQRDAAEPVPLGAVPFKTTLIKQGSNMHALVLRLSHAQYDGLAKSTLFADLKAAYHGRRLTVAASYSQYLSYKTHYTNAQALQFWRDLLKSSSVTKLDFALLGGREPSSEHPESLVLRLRRFSSPPPPEGITIATAFKAAWAIALAELNGERDLVFSQVVNGRNLPLEGIDRVCGTCVNIVPVRVALQPGWTGHDLLRHLQMQHAKTIPFETIDLDDI
ncbi:hypothetical protein B0T10DRAFT_590815, partial [Thelonectria olida]